MGKQLQTFPVIYPGTNNIGFPVKAGTWDFLQAAYNEQFASVIISEIGISYSATKNYILYGCVLSTGGGNTTISAGAIFFNGEIFQYAGQTITGTGNVVCNLLNTPFTESDSGGTPMADPVFFIGGPAKDVHISRTPVFSLGTSGTGMFQSQCSGGTSTSANNDYNNFSVVNSFVSTGIVLASGASNLGSPYYNIAYELNGNICNLSGIVNVSGGVGVLMATLPIAPSKNVIISTSGGNAFALSVVLVEINTSGQILITAPSGSGYVFLDGISFRLN